MVKIGYLCSGINNKTKEKFYSMIDKATNEIVKKEAIYENLHKPKDIVLKFIG